MQILSTIRTRKKAVFFYRNWYRQLYIGDAIMKYNQKGMLWTTSKVNPILLKEIHIYSEGEMK
jgi:hypothetical protein